MQDYIDSSEEDSNVAPISSDEENRGQQVRVKKGE